MLKYFIFLAICNIYYYKKLVKWGKLMLNVRIRELRSARNITQVELARSLSVSKQSISNWENDNILPSIEMLVKIADFFSVSTDYLLGLDDKKYLLISGLNEEQIAHIQQLVDDIAENNQK